MKCRFRNAPPCPYKNLCCDFCDRLCPDRCTDCHDHCDYFINEPETFEEGVEPPKPYRPKGKQNGRK